jgi:hypothetical protein
MTKKNKKQSKTKEEWAKGEGPYGEWPVYPSSSWMPSDSGVPRDTGTIAVNFEDDVSGTYTSTSDSPAITYSYGGVGGIAPASTGAEQDDPQLYGAGPLQGQFEKDAMSGQYTFDYDFAEPKPFEKSMPSLSQVEEMTVIYPSLRIAYEKFKNIYRIVYDDWTARKEKDDV